MASASRQKVGQRRQAAGGQHAAAGSSRPACNSRKQQEATDGSRPSRRGSRVPAKTAARITKVEQCGTHPHQHRPGAVAHGLQVGYVEEIELEQHGWGGGVGVVLEPGCGAGAAAAVAARWPGWPAPGQWGQTAVALPDAALLMMRPRSPRTSGGESGCHTTCSLIASSSRVTMTVTRRSDRPPSSPAHSKRATAQPASA